MYFTTTNVDLREPKLIIELMKKAKEPEFKGLLKQAILAEVMELILTIEILTNELLKLILAN